MKQTKPAQAMELRSLSPVFGGPSRMEEGSVEPTVRYQLNGDDGLECMRVHTPSFRTNVVVSTLASVALIAVGLVWLAFPGNHALAWVSVGTGGAILSVGTLQRKFLVARLRRQWNQMDAMELTVRERGFVAHTRGTQSEVAWSRFVRFREAEQHFLLYSSDDLYSIIPKRGFASQAELDAFREMASKGIASP
jgi:YcxB-like protein